jgi:gluconate 2-dehydrogenase gamma chain
MKARKEPGAVTRRQFMAASAMASAAWAAGCRSQGGDWESLSEDQAGILAAICDQIIPADDYPSASQAGVVTYIDRQLSRHYRRHQMAYARGLGQAESLSTSRFGHRLAQASTEQRLQVARALEQENRTFFELVRKHTLEGYYGSPRHGGNRDAVSWRMLGLAEPPVRGRARDVFSKGTRS